jgi:hypothetical protein
MVEGVFARAFRSRLRPIEIGRRLVREIDDARSVDVKGRVIVPNMFVVELSTGDLSGFTDIREALVRELADAAREYARDEGYTFLGPVSVELAADPALKPGRFGITAVTKETGSGQVGAGSIVTPENTRIPLGGTVLAIGRLPSSEIPVNDANVSRRHAEIRPAGDGWVVVDLQSTNGTKVNGVVINEKRLVDGDVITVGNTPLRFEAS